MPNVFLISIHDSLALLFIWCGVDEGEGLNLMNKFHKGMITFISSSYFEHIFVDNEDLFNASNGLFNCHIPE
jgi:hypothetical protein